MSPPPRSLRSVPVDDTLETSAKRITWLKVLLGALVAAVALGFAAHSYISNLATREDVAQESSQREAVAAKTEERLHDLEFGNRWRDAALKGIADKLGVWVPPPPTPPAP